MYRTQNDSASQKRSENLQGEAGKAEPGITKCLGRSSEALSVLMERFYMVLSELEARKACQTRYKNRGGFCCYRNGERSEDYKCYD